MTRVLLILILFFLFYSCTPVNTSSKPPKITVIDEYHGHQMKDPYRYMENLKDTVLLAWLKEKTEEASVLETIEGRAALLQKIENSTAGNTRISKLKISDNGSFFYLKKEAKNAVAKLYFRPSLTADESLLFDPATYKTHEKKEYVLNYIKPSWDSKKVAVGLTESDKEISEIVIVDVPSKTVAPETLTHNWPAELAGINWLPDNSGFIYVHIPVVDKNEKKYLLNTSSVLYKLGTPANQVTPIFSKQTNSNFPIKEEDFCITRLPDQKCQYIFASTSGATSYHDYYYAAIQDIYSKTIRWKPLFSKDDLIKKILVKEDTLYYLSSKNASNFKLCKTTLSNPDFENPTVVVPEDPNQTITDMALTKHGLYIVKTKNGVQANLYKVVAPAPHLQKIELPRSSGYINIFSKGARFDKLWLQTEGWTSKKELYNYDANTDSFNKIELIKQTSPTAIEDVVIEEIEIPARDGTLIPLSIIYKKGIKKNAANNVLISSYGAYGLSGTPLMYPILKHWVELGGVYAEAHVRGGGEKGDAWRRAGYKTTKANSWRDFIDCTRYLVNQKYTSPNKIAAWTASAGGVCVGRAFIEAPELYSAVMIRSGVLNPLRSEFSRNGKNNIKEFGSVKDSTEFLALRAMDSYHAIQNNTRYPAVYLTAGINDARVPVSHSSKLIARLQDAHPENTALLSVDFNGGHSFDAAQQKRNKELVDFITFAFWQLGKEDFQP